MDDAITRFASPLVTFAQGVEAEIEFEFEEESPKAVGANWPFPPVRSIREVPLQNRTSWQASGLSSSTGVLSDFGVAAAEARSFVETTLPLSCGISPFRRGRYDTHDFSVLEAPVASTFSSSSALGCKGCAAGEAMQSQSRASTMSSSPGDLVKPGGSLSFVEQEDEISRFLIGIGPGLWSSMGSSEGSFLDGSAGIVGRKAGSSNRSATPGGRVVPDSPIGGGDLHQSMRQKHATEPTQTHAWTPNALPHCDQHEACVGQLWLQASPSLCFSPPCARVPGSAARLQLHLSPEHLDSQFRNERQYFQAARDSGVSNLYDLPDSKDHENGDQCRLGDDDEGGGGPASSWMPPLSTSPLPETVAVNSTPARNRVGRAACSSQLLAPRLGNVPSDSQCDSTLTSGLERELLSPVLPKFPGESGKYHLDEAFAMENAFPPGAPHEAASSTSLAAGSTSAANVTKVVPRTAPQPRSTARAFSRAGDDLGKQTVRSARSVHRVLEKVPVPQAEKPPEEHSSGDILLVACTLCGRRFRNDRLAVHQEICKNLAQNNGRRHVFESQSQRCGEVMNCRWWLKDGLKRPQRAKSKDRITTENCVSDAVPVEPEEAAAVAKSPLVATKPFLKRGAGKNMLRSASMPLQCSPGSKASVNNPVGPQQPSRPKARPKTNPRISSQTSQTSTLPECTGAKPGEKAKGMSRSVRKPTEKNESLNGNLASSCRDIHKRSSSCGAGVRANRPGAADGIDSTQKGMVTPSRNRPLSAARRRDDGRGNDIARRHAATTPTRAAAFTPNHRRGLSADRARAGDRSSIRRPQASDDHSSPKRAESSERRLAEFAAQGRSPCEGSPGLLQFESLRQRRLMYSPAKNLSDDSEKLCNSGNRDVAALFSNPYLQHSPAGFRLGESSQSPGEKGIQRTRKDDETFVGFGQFPEVKGLHRKLTSPLHLFSKAAISPSGESPRERGVSGHSMDVEDSLLAEEIARTHKKTNPASIEAAMSDDFVDSPRQCEMVPQLLASPRSATSRHSFSADSDLDDVARLPLASRPGQDSRRPLHVGTMPFSDRNCTSIQREVSTPTMTRTTSASGLMNQSTADWAATPTQTRGSRSMDPVSQPSLGNSRLDSLRGSVRMLGPHETITPSACEDPPDVFAFSPASVAKCGMPFSDLRTRQRSAEMSWQQAPPPLPAAAAFKENICTNHAPITSAYFCDEDVAVKDTVDAVADALAAAVYTGNGRLGPYDPSKYGTIDRTPLQERQLSSERETPIPGAKLDFCGAVGEDTTPPKHRSGSGLRQNDTFSAGKPGAAGEGELGSMLDSLEMQSALFQGHLRECARLIYERRIGGTGSPGDGQD